MPKATRTCKDCGKPLTKARIAKRKRTCFSCEIANKRKAKRKAHDARVEKFGLSAADYWKLYDAQGGTCAIYGCRANGRTKYLSVEHDHNCNRGHPENKCCRYCVRGLTCSVHNGWLGKAGDDPKVFDSLADYLRNPPAQRILND